MRLSRNEDPKIRKREYEISICDMRPIRTLKR